MNYTEKSGLKISNELLEFINSEALPGTDITPDNFWKKPIVKVYTAISFIITTIGFSILTFNVVTYALNFSPFM